MVSEERNQEIKQIALWKCLYVKELINLLPKRQRKLAEIIIFSSVFLSTPHVSEKELELIKKLEFNHQPDSPAAADKQDGE